LAMEREYRLDVPLDAEGKRLDKFLGNQPVHLSRSQVQHLIENGLVRVNAKTRRSSYRVHAGDIIEMQVLASEETPLIPEDIPLDIIYEDEDLLVVNKPQGMVVHPAAGHEKGTLVNALLNHCTQLSRSGDYLRPGIVHRLDKDTSGLLLVGKTDLAHQELSHQLKERQVKRRYLALVVGQVKEDRGVIDAPLGRDSRNRKKIAVLSPGTPGAKEARTHYCVQERFCGYTLLDVSLETGRTHQIRVHLAYAGYPVAGDPIYGTRSNPLELPGQALHAYQITIQHPRTAEMLTFEAPLPRVFTDTLQKMRKC
jgi:23S rRNA pseudouridine1911/1915/1917 synthase